MKYSKSFFFIINQFLNNPRVATHNFLNVFQKHRGEIISQRQ